MNHVQTGLHVGKRKLRARNVSHSNIKTPRWQHVNVQKRRIYVPELRRYVEDGGLMCYGPSLRAMIALWPPYVDKILKGAKPGDLPVQTPTKYELVLNQRAAKELGFKFPGSLLLAADAVIN